MFSPLRMRDGRRGIIAVLFVLSLSLSGCGALRIGYNMAPDLSYWWLDRYVDFSSAQVPRVRAAIAEWFAWHRRSQLPDYAALLARARVEVLSDTTAARVCEWQTELTRRLDRAYEHAAPAIAEIALSVTTAQIRRIERRYSQVNDEFRDDYLQPDADERAQATLKRTVERAETLYGRLDANQRSRIAEDLPRSPFDPDLWFSERRARQLDTLRLIGKFNASAITLDQAQLALHDYVDRIKDSPRDGYRQYVERLSEFNCNFAATLHNSTTAIQREHAAAKIAGWERDVRALAAASQVGAPDQGSITDSFAPPDH